MPLAGDTISNAEAIGPLAAATAVLHARSAGSLALSTIARGARDAVERLAFAPLSISFTGLTGTLPTRRDIVREALQRAIAGSELAVVVAPPMARAVITVTDLDLARPTVRKDELAAFAPVPIVVTGHPTRSALTVAFGGVAWIAERDAGTHLTDIGAEPKARRAVRCELTRLEVPREALRRPIDLAGPPASVGAGHRTWSTAGFAGRRRSILALLMRREARAGHQANHRSHRYDR